MPKPTPKPTAAAKPTAPALSTDEQKTIYALGLQMYRSLAQFDLSPAEVELIRRAAPGRQAAGKPAAVVRTNGDLSLVAGANPRGSCGGETEGGLRRVSRKGGRGARRHEDRVWTNLQGYQARNRCLPDGLRFGEGQL